MKDRINRVIIAITSMHFGGAERRASLLCNFLISCGIDVCLCYTGNSRDNSVYQLDSKVSVFYLKNTMINFAKYLSKFINPGGGLVYHLKQIRLRRKIKRFKPEIIISFMASPTKSMAEASKGTDIPIIFVVANDIDQKKKEYIKYYKESFNKLAGIVFQTKAQKIKYNDMFLFDSSINQVVISNPAWESQYWYTSVTERKKEIISVGRLVRQKNQELLINAFSLIAEKFPDWMLTIYGEGGHRQLLETVIKMKNLSYRVILPGIIKDVDRALHQAGIFVLSSEYEGLPNTLIEAMCMGLPCITTDFKGGGAEEIIKNGENGIIVPNHNEKLLADAIVQLIENPEYAMQLGKKAEELRTRLSLSRIMNQWKDFILLVYESSRLDLDKACDNK